MRMREEVEVRHLAGERIRVVVEVVDADEGELVHCAWCVALAAVN